MTRNETDLQKFATAFTEAAAPELRAAVYGRGTSEKRFREELLRQLNARNVCDIDADGEQSDESTSSDSDKQE